MSKKYDAKFPFEIQDRNTGEQKTIWLNAGITVTVRDDGKMSMFDGRGGLNYQLFERKPRENNSTQAKDYPEHHRAPSEPSLGDGHAPKQDDGLDDIPF